MSGLVLFLKAHIKGYTRKDGTFVAEHDDKRAKRGGRTVLHHSHSSAMDPKVFAGMMANDGEAQRVAALAATSPAHGLDRYVLQEDPSNPVDLIVWHGTAAKHLDTILRDGLKPLMQNNGRTRVDDVGKVFVAADKSDARTFAVWALSDRHDDIRGLKKLQEEFSIGDQKIAAEAILLAIRLPAEARDRVEWMQNGVEEFGNCVGGVPPEWIVGYQTLTSENEDDIWNPKTKYTRLHKSDSEDGSEGADRFLVILCSGRDEAPLAKAHIKGYLRSDGTFVPEHDDKRAAAKQKTVAPHLTGLSKKPWSQSSFFSGSASGHGQSPKKPASANAVYHPKLNSKGELVELKFPHKDGPPEAWLGADHIATVKPGGWTPKSLNGVQFAPWKDAPKTLDEWENVPGQMDDLEEPALVVGVGKHASAGVVVEEPDGRVWVVHPSNAYGGYRATFPKGTIEDDEDLSFQAVAIKEAFEESGLQVAITGFLQDVDRSTSVCRYYRARRVGGTPSDCGWESQAVSLVPAAKLYSLLNKDVDHPLAESVGAGPRPKPKPKPSAQPWKGSGSGGGKGAQLPPTPFGNKKPGSLF